MLRVHSRPRSHPRARNHVLAGLTVVLLTVLGLAAAPAGAATFDVWSCKTPSGTPTSTAGWTSSSSLLYDQPGDDCRSGGRLTAKFSATGGAVSGGLASQWTFTAPDGLGLVAAELRGTRIVRTGQDRGGASETTIFSAAKDDGAPGGRAPVRTLASCRSDSAAPCTSREPSRVKVARGATLGFSAGCAGVTGRSLCGEGTGSRATAAIDAAKLTLEDAAPPAAKASGKVLRAGPVRGRTSVRLDATDVGSGIYEAEVRLGPTVVRPRGAIDRNGGRCRTLPGTRAFGWPVPCARRVGVTIPFGTKDVRDGSQLLTVTVWDAAGNATVAVTKPVSVDNARRIQADGTILMPRIADPLDEAFGAAGGGGAAGSNAVLRPPTSGPDPQLARIVDAMNILGDAQIAYCYGGGHGTTPAVPSTGSYCWQGNPARKVRDSGATGLDCSSSVSWVLQQAGYDLPTVTSSELARTGEAGEGRYLTIWANPSHVFLEVKIGDISYYWGTTATNPQHGPGWHPARSTGAFTPRHLPGL